MINRKTFQSIPSPCFVLEEDKYLSNIDTIKNFQKSAGVRIIPAFKGFASWRAFEPLKNGFDGAAVSSLDEAQLCNEQLGKKAYVYSPAYSKDDYLALLPMCGHLTFNSLSQFKRLFPTGPDNCDVSFGIRINPGYSPVKADLYNPCSPGSRLGIPPTALAKGLPEGLEGIHVHALCESSADHLIELMAAVSSQTDAALKQSKWLNLGGGHLITSKGYDIQKAVHIIKSFQKAYPVQIILEPGAAFVWQAGFLLSTVLDVVDNCGIKTAMLDISFAAHTPDCLEMPYQPHIRGARPNEGKYMYKMGGNTCLAGDAIGMYGFEKPLKAGQRLVFEDMMHYTMVKTNFFNGVRHPHVGMLKKEGGFDLWRSFGYEDYKARLG